MYCSLVNFRQEFLEYTTFANGGSKIEKKVLNSGFLAKDMVRDLVIVTVI